MARFVLCRRSHRADVESQYLVTYRAEKGQVMADLLELDEQVLTSDIPDEVLERAASAEQNAFTLAYCTNPWYNCGLERIN